MTLWFVFAVMTAAAIFAVLLPLGLGGRAQTGGSETAVYKDQLAEIDRDVGAGLIGAAEAEAARVEIGRRLLAAADQTRNPPVQSDTRLRRSAAVLALVGLPILAVAFYLPLGSPRLGDFPLAQRMRAPDATQPLDTLVAQVEQHLEKDPTDARGWAVLAPVLARLSRFDEAVIGGQISARSSRPPRVASSPPRPRPNSNARGRWMPARRKPPISSGSRRNRTGAIPMPPRSGGRCLRKRRGMRRGGRWLKPH